MAHILSERTALCLIKKKKKKKSKTNQTKNIANFTIYRQYNNLKKKALLP
jgi:hypothetical protein